MHTTHSHTHTLTRTHIYIYNGIFGIIYHRIAQSRMARLFYLWCQKRPRETISNFPEIQTYRAKVCFKTIVGNISFFTIENRPLILLWILTKALDRTYKDGYTSKLQVHDPVLQVLYQLYYLEYRVMHSLYGGNYDCSIYILFVGDGKMHSVHHIRGR